MNFIQKVSLGLIAFFILVGILVMCNRPEPYHIITDDGYCSVVTKEDGLVVESYFESDDMAECWDWYRENK